MAFLTGMLKGFLGGVLVITIFEFIRIAITIHTP